jgi:hypothetical protein
MDDDYTNISDEEQNQTFIQMRDMEFQFEKAREARPGTMRSFEKPSIDLKFVN